MAAASTAATKAPVEKSSELIREVEWRGKSSHEDATEAYGNELKVWMGIIKKERMKRYRFLAMTCALRQNFIAISSMKIEGLLRLR